MRKVVWTVGWASAVLSIRAVAQTYSVGGQRDAWITTTTLRPLVVGADAFQLRRDVEIGDFKEELEVTRYSGFLGVQIRPWLTFYGTLGHVDADLGVDTLDNGIAGSVGLQGRLWKMDVRDPAFMAGRASLRAGVEYLYADPDLGHWQTLNATVQLHYELFTEGVQTTERVPYSLGLYIGPVYSWLDGEAVDALWGDEFEGAASWGIAAGAELNLAHNLMLAIGLEYLDHTSWGVALRYTF